MKQTFDILASETVKQLMQIGKVKQLKDGIRYLVVEEIDEK